MKVLVYGSLNMDYVYTVDHIVSPGETEATGGLKAVCGGKGLNQAIALARAGAAVWMAGQVGEDGDELRTACAGAGVHTEFIDTVPGRSGHTIIQVDKNAQNCILLYGGANQSQKQERIDTVLSAFAPGDILLLQNEISELPYIIDRAKADGLTVVLNPSPFNAALDACDLGKVDLFLLNEVEGLQMTGAEDPEEILMRLAEQYPMADVLLTLGTEGSVWQDHASGERCREACCEVKAVDTTAAGDTYTGYFLACRLEGKPVRECMRMASLASAIACTRAGASVSIPERAEVSG